MVGNLAEKVHCMYVWEKVQQKQARTFEEPWILLRLKHPCHI